jgi:hypothetical protein
MLVVLALLAACGGGGSSPRRASSSASTPPAPTVTSTPPPATTAPPPPPPTNPLTGLPGDPPASVVAVKIDDTENGRPQIGIDAADVVYIELAEGGLTRVLAIFASQLPTVGPVRSLRPSDPELVSEYGPVAIAASGGAGAAISAVDSSILVDARYDNVPSAYNGTGGRYAPYNLVADLSAVASASHPAGAKDVGFRWAADDPRLAAAPIANQFSVPMSQQTTVSFTYDAASGRYVRYIDGVAQTADGGAPVSTPNVLVQECTVVTDPSDVDVNGVASQYTQSVGSGPATLFRAGKRIDGTWSRPALDAPTTFTAADGQPMLLAPGGVWVALVPQGAPITSG